MGAGSGLPQARSRCIRCSARSGKRALGPGQRPGWRLSWDRKGRGTAEPGAVSGAAHRPGAGSLGGSGRGEGRRSSTRGRGAVGPRGTGHLDLKFPDSSSRQAPGPGLSTGTMCGRVVSEGPPCSLGVSPRTQMLGGGQGRAGAVSALEPHARFSSQKAASPRGGSNGVPPPRSSSPEH